MLGTKNKIYIEMVHNYTFELVSVYVYQKKTKIIKANTIYQRN